MVRKVVFFVVLSLCPISFGVDPPRPRTPFQTLLFKYRVNALRRLYISLYQSKCCLVTFCRHQSKCQVFLGYILIIHAYYITNTPNTLVSNFIQAGIASCSPQCAHFRYLLRLFICFAHSPV